MKKTSKIVMLLCLTGTFVLSFQSVKNSNTETNIEPLVQNETTKIVRFASAPIDNILPKNVDSETVISRTEQDIIESMANAIPGFGMDWTFVSQGEGKGFYFKKE